VAPFILIHEEHPQHLIYETNFNFHYDETWRAHLSIAPLLLVLLIYYFCVLALSLHMNNWGLF